MVNHEMLTRNWKESEIIDAISVQLETDNLPQLSKRWKNKDDDAYEGKKKIWNMIKATQTDENK